MLLTFSAAAAEAAPVLVLTDDGRVKTSKGRFVPKADLPRPPRASVVRTARARKAQRGPRVEEELERLLAEGQIDQAQHDAARNNFRWAKRTYRRLDGTPSRELRAAVRNVKIVARSGELTASRLNAIVLTLARNREWWRDGVVPSSGQRVRFQGTRLIWQYYPGQGLAIQPLANFGKANAFWAKKKRKRLRKLLGELMPLAAERGGAPVWEYYFRFGGGDPPWTSALSQGTAVQALGRASDLLGDPVYRDLAARSLAIFEQEPPTGVRVPSDAGAHYLIYTFDPDLRVLNGFLQSVIGLFDFAELTGDPRARALYEAGEAEARADVPRYDTGAWSLYSLERESSLSYHRLVTRFLERLCERAGQPVYCDTATRFTGYLDTPPEVDPVTRRVRGGKPAKLRFELSKISRVGVSVINRRGRAVFETSATVGRGERFFRWPKPPRKARRYTLRVSATDLAGNSASAEGPLRVLKAAR